MNANRVNKVLHSPYEYVVDYDFVGDNILVATYSGRNGRNAKLFLLNKERDVLATCKMPQEPLSLFKSCVGSFYCVCSDRFYPLSIDSNKIAIRKPYNINLLEGLQQCEQSIDGNFYYRIGDNFNFRMVYGMVAKGDTVFKPFIKFEEKKVAEASAEEYSEILYCLEHYNFHEAAHLQRLRTMWDKSSYGHIDIPIFTCMDTLIIFDYEKKQIRFYNNAGEPIKNVAIKFEWKTTQRFEIIKDEMSNKFYLHSYDSQRKQALEELNIAAGTLSANKILIDNPFAESVKIYNGDIYFLWQDSHSSATRQLFIQSIY